MGVGVRVVFFWGGVEVEVVVVGEGGRGRRGGSKSSKRFKKVRFPNFSRGTVFSFFCFKSLVFSFEFSWQTKT